MISPTKLLTSILYQLNGWDLVFNQGLNFFIFGITALAVILFFKKFFKNTNTLAISLFSIFLLSCLPSENHFWGFQSQFHFVLLFFFLSVIALFTEKPTFKRTILGTLLALCSLFSFSSGVVSCLVLLGVYSTLSVKRKSWTHLAVVAPTLLAGIFFWFSDYHPSAAAPGKLTPFHFSFWDYLVNLVSFGFGFETISFTLGAFCLLVVLAPLVIIAWKKKLNLNTTEAALLTVILGLLASLAAITLGRAGIGPITEKVSRYGEIAIFLPPFAVMAWLLVLSSSTRYFKYFAICLWLFMFVGYLNKWGAPGVYRSKSWLLTDSLTCVENHYFKKGNDSCPRIYPIPMAYQLDRAKNLNLSFYKKMKAKQEN